MKKILGYSLIGLFLLDGTLLADEFDDEFGDEEIKVVEVKKGDDKKFIFYGSLSLSSYYNYAYETLPNSKNDFSGLGSAKLSSNINFEKKFNNGYKIKSTIKAHNDFIYDLRGDDYPPRLKDYEKDFDINELYFEGKIGQNIDFRIGRQIVVWGKSDNIRVTDVLNPINNLTPAMVDIKDLRLGRVMSKIDYYLENGWALNGIVIHENRFTQNPQSGSEFKGGVEKEIDEPSDSLKNSGVAVSFSKNFTGWDLAFYYANQYLDKTYLDNGVLKYGKSNIYGVAYNRVIDNFLIKSEIAYFDNVKYSLTNSKKRVDLLLGVEYNGITEGSISFEIIDRKIFDYEEVLNSPQNNFTKQNEYQYAMRFKQSYLNQTLDFTTLVTLFGKDLEDGGFARVWFDYAIDDKLSTTLGVLNYIGGEKQNWENLKDNDKVFASLKYSF